jgi:GAF domain-containing protein
MEVINSSPGNLAPVFEAMLEKALRLCGADLGNLLTYHGECFEAVVGIYGTTGVGERELSRGRFRPWPGGPLERLVSGEHFTHSEDVRTEVTYQRNAHFRELVDGGGYQSITHVALRKESQLLGVTVIFFKERRKLTDKQIALLQNFAAQAVIAMENARLITERARRSNSRPRPPRYCRSSQPSTRTRAPKSATPSSC